MSCHVKIKNKTTNEFTKQEAVAPAAGTSSVIKTGVAAGDMKEAVEAAAAAGSLSAVPTGDGQGATVAAGKKSGGGEGAGGPEEDAEGGGDGDDIVEGEDDDDSPPREYRHRSNIAPLFVWPDSPAPPKVEEGVRY